jgi:hypothetical protein
LLALSLSRSLALSLARSLSFLPPLPPSPLCILHSTNAARPVQVRRQAEENAALAAEVARLGGEADAAGQEAQAHERSGARLGVQVPPSPPAAAATTAAIATAAVAPIAATADSVTLGSTAPLAPAPPRTPDGARDPPRRSLAGPRERPPPPLVLSGHAASLTPY